MTVEELKSKLDEGQDIQIIDIREQYEREIASMNAEHIPLGDVMSNLDKIRKDIPVVIHCKSGDRGGKLTFYLKKQGYSNVHNLEGGINAWAERIDSSIQPY